MDADNLTRTEQLKLGLHCLAIIKLKREILSASFFTELNREIARLEKELQYRTELESAQKQKR